MSLSLFLGRRPKLLQFLSTRVTDCLVRYLLWQSAVQFLLISWAYGAMAPTNSHLEMGIGFSVPSYFVVSSCAYLCCSYFVFALHNPPLR